MRHFQKRYGAGPVHLLLLLASFAIGIAAMARLFDTGGSDTRNAFIWLSGAVVGHDLIFLPLYSLADRILSRATGAEGRVRARVQSASQTRIALLNHIRIPALLSGLLLLVFFPLILHHSAETYRDASSLSQDTYTSRWLIATALLFAISAVIGALRALRHRTAKPASPSKPASP